MYEQVCYDFTLYTKQSPFPSVYDLSTEAKQLSSTFPLKFNEGNYLALHLNSQP